MRPLASLLAVATTVTTPAVLAACVALCMPGMRGHVMTTVAEPIASVAAADEAGCAEHEAAAPVGAGVAVAASDAACCVDGLTAAAPSVAAERADTRAGAAGEFTPVVTWTSAPLDRATVRVAHDRGSPPPLLRRSSVLRI